MQGERQRDPAGGFRVAAPDSSATVRWPERFGTRFVVCVDTEEEFDWGRPLARESRSTTHMAAMPAAHARFAAHGVPLAYLVDHPIATCSRSIDILRRLTEDGRSTIGTQLHPWVNPPFDEALNGPNSFAGNLPRTLEAAKLSVLTEAITGAFGTRPTIYRAGRYGLGANTLELLSGLGYLVDSSMRSCYDYSGERGPDFGLIPNHAFWTGPGATLLELPLTTAFIGRVGRSGRALHRALGHVPRGRGIAARLGLVSRVALTPEDMPIGAALEAVRVAVGEGVRLLNFSFHSPSIEPGHTPYVRDATDLATFYDWWDRMFALMVQLGIAPASVAEVVEAACGARPISASAGGAGGL
jgi:hypothetical protein